jgi:hypothetical protein
MRAPFAARIVFFRSKCLSTRSFLTGWPSPKSSGAYVPAVPYLFEMEARPAFIGISYRFRCGRESSPLYSPLMRSRPRRSRNPTVPGADSGAEQAPPRFAVGSPPAGKHAVRSRPRRANSPAPRGAWQRTGRYAGADGRHACPRRSRAFRAGQPRPGGPDPPIDSRSGVDGRSTGPPRIRAAAMETALRYLRGRRMVLQPRQTMAAAGMAR